MTMKILSLLLLIIQIKSDLPVHCIARDIEGDWIFYINPGFGNQQISCGHSMPDKNTDHIYSHDDEILEGKQQRKIKLTLPNIALDMESQQTGEWTMVYDEGFQVKINDEVFFAFSKYKMKERIIPKDDDDEQTRGYQSICDETFVGWYHHETEQKWGCYSGKKSKKIQEKINYLENIQGDHMKIVQRDIKNEKIITEEPKTQFIDQLSANKKSTTQFQQVNTQNYISPEIMKAQNTGFYNRFKQNLPLYNIPHTNYLFNNYNKNGQSNDQFNHDYSFIELVNNEENQSPWTAKAHDHFQNKTHSEMQKLIGLGGFAQDKLNLANSHNETSNLDITLNVSNVQDNNQTQAQNNTIQENTGEQITLKQMSFLETEMKIKANQEFLTRDQSIFYKYNYESNNLEVNKGIQQNVIFLDQLFKLNFNQKLDDSNICGNSNTNIPRCFDWRNVDGINYESEVKKQGDCGSCYAVAVLSSLEARIKIKSKNMYGPQLSVAGSMACSRYNQGCNGGYPFLVAKQGHEFGFYEDFCQPYNDYNQQCRAQCFQLGKIWKVKDYGYVGKGYYGSTNEEEMMKEIYENGPVAVAINSAPDLYYYSTGVFITNPQNRLRQSNKRNDIHPWEFTNHAVSCVGWGEKEHQGEIIKYWILKNSWGKEWGENGYFKMLKGQNLAAVENQAVYLNPSFD